MNKIPAGVLNALCRDLKFKGSIINVGVRKPNEKNKLSIFEKTFKM